MTMSQTLQSAFNDQIQLEFSSAYTYLGMTAWCESRDLAGFARWMRAQASEETEHAMKFLDFVLGRDGTITLQPIEAPSGGFSSVLDVLEQALGHEQRVTAAIGRLYAQASEEGDYSSLPLLQWFMGEQVEEEATVRQIVAELRMVGDDTSALLLLDRDMGARRGPSSDPA
ncbi:ferritin [soil metagenome]